MVVGGMAVVEGGEVGCWCLVACLEACENTFRRCRASRSSSLASSSSSVRFRFLLGLSIGVCSFNSVV